MSDLNFPSNLSSGEREVEAILFAAAEPLDIDTIESKLSKNINVEKCKLTGVKKESHYLDYWWAVILIIAITFFIFTQSGKRLKQIRRK